MKQYLCAFYCSVFSLAAANLPVLKDDLDEADCAQVLRDVQSGAQTSRQRITHIVDDQLESVRERLVQISLRIAALDAIWKSEEIPQHRQDLEAQIYELEQLKETLEVYLEGYFQNVEELKQTLRQQPKASGCVQFSEGEASHRRAERMLRPKTPNVEGRKDKAYSRFPPLRQRTAFQE